MDSPDLQAKYQKLASEYTKLRAQNQVLKKAVIDEQGKNTQLKEQLKSRDQALRKLEQEVDSVAFRNQQLTKRFALLQDDLECLQNKPRKNHAKEESQPSNSILDNNVYAEELESKIKENARLHAELSEQEIYYKYRVAEYESRLQEITKEALQTNENIRAQERILQAEIKKLENERVVQEVHAQQRESKIVELQSQIKSFKGINDGDSSPSSNSKREKVPASFPVALEQKINNSKKPPDGKVISNLCEPMKSMTSGFVDFLLEYSSLLKQSVPMSSVQLKLAEQLSCERNSWHLLSRRYEEMAMGLDQDGPVVLEKLVGLDAFSKALASSASSLRKLLPVLSEKWLCFHEGQLDAPWRSTLGRLVSCIAAINPYVSSLAAHSDARAVLTPSAIRKILNLLYERIMKLHTTSQELVTAWELLSIEDKKCEDSIKRSLVAIETSLSKISKTFFDQVLPPYNDGTSYSGSPSSGQSHSPATPNLMSSSAMSLLASPDGCLYEGLQLADNETTFAQQLAQATSRLSKLEEEREHWRLEYQLLNHKFEKETKRCEILKEELNVLRNSSKESHPYSEALEQSLEDKNDSQSSSIVGEVTCVSSSNEQREKEIREHFTNRCSHLYMQLTSCLSQASLYQNECENLIRRLALSEESRSAAEQEVEKQRKEKVEIQENLSTTSRNYEEQISTMSDHLADLNEKITKQADSIEQLKFELKKKGKK